jgi:hypothetical protein
VYNLTLKFYTDFLINERVKCGFNEGSEQKIYSGTVKFFDIMKGDYVVRFDDSDIRAFQFVDINKMLITGFIFYIFISLFMKYIIDSLFTFILKDVLINKRVEVKKLFGTVKFFDHLKCDYVVRFDDGSFNIYSLNDLEKILIEGFCCILLY